jgi:immune inhibitor A
MRRRTRVAALALPMAIAVLMLLILAIPALANPPAPGGNQPPTTIHYEGDKPYAAREVRPAKATDRPNPEDYLRNQQRQRLLEAGETSLASSLALSGTDRVLVILVEFAGTDVFTWTSGSTWDPYGIADESEGVYDAQGNLLIGDCSNIINQTTVFTYSGPMHNTIARPTDAEDPSGTSIWTEDFSPQWFTDFMFGNGVTIDYLRQDGSAVHADFTGESVRNYYDDLSDGAYTINGDVVGWLQLPHSTWWYGADECPGKRSPYDAGIQDAGAIPNTGGDHELVIDALKAVNAISNTISGFDWANYDQDGDGVIDRLWIVHAGYGEEDNPTLLNRNPTAGSHYGEAAMWSHSSQVTPPYSVTQDIAASAYIMMPENGGIGVFAHEYGHNLGADDLYAYGEGETSAGFWTLMADDWTGDPIGFEPPAPDPWHLDNWGWLEPMVINDPSQVYTVVLGQASEFPGGSNVYRGVKIELPDGMLPLPVPVWQGNHYWWGDKLNLANAMMTSAAPINIPAGGATLSFDLVYDIEDEWDFLWVQASADGGATWDTLTNANTQCAADPSWIGPLYVFPSDPCAAGIGGFYGYNANWPDPQMQQFSLAAYAGQNIKLRFWYMTDWGTTYTGAFIDNVQITSGAATLFSDDAEAGDAKWIYEYPWQRSNGAQAFTHNYYFQWRNTNPNGGYDSALGETNWRFGPANTGLLVWYNNNYYTDNEIFSYLFDDPGFGPKGRMLVVDAHPEPYRDPFMVQFGYNNEGGNVTDRSQMRDAPFTLAPTVDFTMKPPYVVSDSVAFDGRPAAQAFHDLLGYYQGAEYVSRGPTYPPETAMKWVTTQWDASTVVPATDFYGIRAPGYTGDEEFRFDCLPYTEGPYTGYLSCYWLGSNTGLGYDGGTGNPMEVDGAYGWHVQVISEAADHRTATVVIWNAQALVEVEKTVDLVEAYPGDELTYSVTVTNTSPASREVNIVDGFPEWLGGVATATLSLDAATHDSAVFPVTLPTCMTLDTIITNTATVTADGISAVTNMVTTTVTTPLSSSLEIEGLSQEQEAGDVVTFTLSITNNDDRPISAFFYMPIPEGVTYVDGSGTGGVTPVGGGLSAAEISALLGTEGPQALDKLAAAQGKPVALVWSGTLAPGSSTAGLGWAFEIDPSLGGLLKLSAGIYEVGCGYEMGTLSTTMVVAPVSKIYFPIILKQ